MVGSILSRVASAPSLSLKMALVVTAFASCNANATETCPADLNCSGQVDSPDISVLLAAWGTPGADLNGDGITSSQDLAVLLSAWGSCPSCQDEGWTSEFGQYPGGFGPLSAMIDFDDGTGLKLWLGGYGVSQVAGNPAKGIATWDGSRLSVPPGGLDYSLGIREIFDFEVYQGQLYAAGQFDTSIGGMGTVNGVARWNGTYWEPLGSGLQRSDGYSGIGFMLEVFEGELFAAGDFDFAGGQPASNIARWNGTQWRAVDVGVSATVATIKAFNDGTSTVLAVGGGFVRAGTASATTGGVVVNRIAKWSSSGGWQPFTYTNPSTGVQTVGVSSTVWTLKTTNAGGSPALYVGGAFLNAGGWADADRIARWSGNAWSAVAPNFPTSTAYEIGLDEVNGQLTVYAGGPIAGGIRVLAGGAWSNLDGGLGNFTQNPTVFSVYRSAFGLMVSGEFARGSGRNIRNIARWNGVNWQALATGLLGEVKVVQQLPLGQVLLAGSVTEAGSYPMGGAAIWDGTDYSSLGNGFNGVIEHATIYRGELVIAGAFSLVGPAPGIPAARIARWNGSQWSQLLGGVDGEITSLLVVGDDLYVGGRFDQASGLPATQKLARWDGTAWHSVSSTTVPVSVEALAFYQGKLYVGGSNLSLPPLYRLDGGAWTPLLGPANGVQAIMDIAAMQVVDFDGCGPGGEVLAIGGRFERIQSAETNGKPLPNSAGVAIWNGSNWAGAGASAGVSKFAVLPTGSAESLVAIGGFTSMGSVAARHVARFDGGAWFDLGASFPVAGSTPVSGVGVVQRNGRPEVWIGGSFLVGPAGESGVARWGCRD